MADITKFKTANHDEWLNLRGQYIGGVVKVKTDCEKQRVVFTVPHGLVSVIQGGGKEL